MDDLSYFGWLINQIRVPPSTTREYGGLWQRMLQKEFVAVVPMDDNRIRDALALRPEFDDRYNHYSYDRTAPCTVLEIMIALSRRVAFQTDDDAPGWAWQLMLNLGLKTMSDPVGATRTRAIDQILEDLVWRTYSPDGQGGFFPLAFPDGDQRHLEIWHQMSFYIAELPY